MLKVLIADDEVKVIQLIEYLVNWKSYDMEIIGRVNDGESALSFILKEHPDIVITDIRMPVINGIELVERSLEADLHPFFIIVSGYSEFEYAQKAIQMGVEDYLLKPLKRKDLELVLEKIRRKYEMTQQANAEKQELKKSRDRARNNLLTDIIVKKSTLPFSLSPEQFEAEYGCLFTGSYMECLVAHIFTGIPDDTFSSEEEYRFILPKILQAIETRLTPLCEEVVSTIWKDELICLINHNAKDKLPIYEELEKLKINVLNYRNIYPDLRIAIGMSKPVTQISLIEESYHDAKKALIKRFWNEDSFILKSDDYFIPESEIRKIISPSDRKAIVARIELLDIPGFRKIADSCFRNIKDNPGQGDNVREAYQTLCETVLYGFQSFEDISPENLCEAERLPQAFDCLYTFEELKNHFIQCCTALLGRYSEEKKSLEEKPIRQAKAYIQEHYSEAITLETVSSEVGFNPAYLSTVFKKTTGQNFMDYVKEVRISNARELLIHTNLDVAAVAQSVGYSDIKYFSRLFRKSTHLTPTDYRKLYG